MSLASQMFTYIRTRCQLYGQKHILKHFGIRGIVCPAHTFSTNSTSEANKGNSKRKVVDISENPFFDKYKSKLQYLQSANPEEYNEKVKELSERFKPKKADVNARTASSDPGFNPIQVTPPSETARAGAGMTSSKGLDSILKMDLIHDKTAEEISKIWNQYHSGKDCVYAVLKAEDYENLREKSKECPVFVYPVRRDDGFEFILSQFDRNEVYFTPLGMFQMVRENAPPCLTLTHYTDLIEDKGIVLMNGQFDEKVLKQQLALSLVQQMSIYYGRNSKFYNLVYRFNYEPHNFQYQELIDALKSLPQYDIK
ncbi:unnamed protein product [Candidula unifasciata]|uniref:ATP synthase mitochondrial F1 complex assembly factor 1 n=1 Tax=Candidula unifasciata TaxID=100452 RepID=A0A8S3Z3W3_9EUPU|nr:unnamed protein product [Candidula unifasciata]